MPTICAALWSLVPRGQAWQSKTLNYKLGELTSAVQVAENRLARRLEGNNAGRGGVRWLFMSPEYTFSRQDTTGTRGHLQISHDDQRAVKRTLTNLTQRYTDLLLMPGTTAYKKPIFGTPDPRTTISRMRKLYQGHDRHNEVLTAKGNQAGALQSSRQQAQASRQWFRDHRDDGDNAELARNTAYAYFQGLQVLKTHKSADIGETHASEPQLHFGRGLQTPIWNNDLTWAVEICADASHGLLTADVDMHMVVADGLDYAHSVDRSVEYLLMAEPGSTGVWRNGNQQRPFKITQVGGFDLHLFSLAA